MFASRPDLAIGSHSAIKFVAAVLRSNPHCREGIGSLTAREANGIKRENQDD